MRTCTPRRWHSSTSSTHRSSGKSESAMITSCTAYSREHARQILDLPERAQAVVGPRLQRDEAHHLDRQADLVRQGVRDALDVVARPDQHRAAAVAGLAQQEPGGAVVEVPEGADVEDPEAQRAVEDVVARVLLAVRRDQRVDERDERRLEEAGDDLRQAGARGPVGIQPLLREQQDHDQEGERDVLVRRRPHDLRVPDAVEHDLLEQQAGEDRQRDRDEVERQEAEDAQRAPQGLHAQQERQRRGPAHVGRRQECRRRGLAARRSLRCPGALTQRSLHGP